MSRVCVACRGQRLEAISEDLRYSYEQAGVTTTWRYRWLRCAGCELSMLDPEPGGALVQSFVARWGTPRAVRAGALRAGWSQARARLGNSFSVLSFVLALQLPKDAVILDLASRDGRWVSLLAARGYRRLHAHMVAARAQRLDMLRQRGIAVTDGSFLGQEFPSASYDCIRIHDGLASLPEPAATVRQCLRMLKPSGVLLVHVPAPQAPRRCVARAQFAGDRAEHEAPCHIYHPTGEALRALLTAAGFRDLKALASRDRQSLLAIFHNMRQQAGKPALPFLLRMLVRPAYALACVWRDAAGQLTLIAREPAVVQRRPSSNGHAHPTRGIRHALFTRAYSGSR
jgi:SAM-dependent methyltransferase